MRSMCSDRNRSYYGTSVLSPEHAGTWPLPDDITEAERAAIALELGRVPPTYATFILTRKLRQKRKACPTRSYPGL
jgi:hypothetical protein